MGSWQTIQKDEFGEDAGRILRETSDDYYKVSDLTLFLRIGYLRSETIACRMFVSYYYRSLMYTDLSWHQHTTIRYAEHIIKVEVKLLRF